MFKSGKLFVSLFGNSASASQYFHPTQVCPECGTRLMRAGETEPWSCPNLDCPVQIRRRIEHWCSPGAMDIAGGDAALVAKLVAKGLVRDVAELYRLKLAEVAALEGMDRATAKSFVDAIAASRKREGWRLLFGLDIPHLTADQAKSLCRQFSLVDNVFAASVERLINNGRVDVETARSIVHWHGDGVNRKLVKRLFKAGLNFKADHGA